MKRIFQTMIVVLLLVMSMGNSVFAQCTCPVGCSSVITITIPFSQEGAGEYCFRTTCLGTYINSWNIDVLQINGIAQIIGYIDASILPPPTGDGYYYIYYKSTLPYGHLEIGGTCAATTLAPTTPPSDTPFPTPNDWIIITPVPTDPPATSGPTDAPTATPATTETPGPTSVPTATPVTGTTDAPTTVPTPDTTTAGPTTDPATCIDCAAITVPPASTVIPTNAPAGTPASTMVPKVGLFQMNYPMGTSQVKPVCSTFETTVYFNSGTTQLLSDYSIKLTYDSTAMTPYICTGTNGVVPGVNGFVSSVDASTAGTLVINGTNTTGTGPGTALHVCSIMWKAISFGESTFIVGDSYVKQVTVTLTPNYVRDTAGSTIGTPTGDTQVYIFYSGTTIPVNPEY